MTGPRIVVVTEANLRAHLDKVVLITGRAPEDIELAVREAARRERAAAVGPGGWEGAAAPEGEASLVGSAPAAPGGASTLGGPAAALTGLPHRSRGRTVDLTRDPAVIVSGALKLYSREIPSETAPRPPAAAVRPAAASRPPAAAVRSAAAPRPPAASAHGAAASGAEVWVFAGALARATLGDLPCQGLTLMEGRNAVSVLTWRGGAEILSRLAVHEWCHSRRLGLLGVTSQGEYARYLRDVRHWLYEETLAMATEKRLHPHLSWDEAAGFAWNPRLRALAEVFRGTEPGAISPATLVAELSRLEAGGASEDGPGGGGQAPGPAGTAALVYFTAYRLCVTGDVDRRLGELMLLRAEAGLEALGAGHPQDSGL